MSRWFPIQALRFSSVACCSICLLLAAPLLAPAQQDEDAQQQQENALQDEDAQQDEAAADPAEAAEKAAREHPFGLAFEQAAGPRILVAAVAPGSPADKAGIEKGDEIIGLDDRALAVVADLGALLSAVEPGERVTLQLFRGEDNRFEAALELPKSDRPVAEADDKPEAGDKPAAEAGFSGMVLREDSAGRVVVAEVSPNTPAEAAGIRKGDVLISVDKKRAAPLDQLTPYAAELFTRLKPGDVVPVKIRRGDEEAVVELTVTQETQPREPSRREEQLVPDDVLTTIGLSVLERPSQVLRVSSVVPHSPAAVAGIERGDIIRSLAGQPIGSAQELTAVMAMHKPGDPAQFEVVREGETVTGSISLRAEPVALTDYVKALQDQVDALARTVEALSKEIESMQGAGASDSRPSANPRRSMHDARRKD